ncbi:hypothetical protein ACTSBL_005112, partial [Escherichia coli]|nr:hypothetical protein [Escherichia coli]
KLQQIAGSGAGNMPVSVETFNNYLKSHMRDEWNKTRAVAIRNELVRRGVIKDDCYYGEPEGYPCL